MTKKTLFRNFACLLAVTFALLSSCTNNASTGNPSSHSAMPAGSNENPKTAIKKETGGS
jgi:hypothetical protein